MEGVTVVWVTERVGEWEGVGVGVGLRVALPESVAGRDALRVWLGVAVGEGERVGGVGVGEREGLKDVVWEELGHEERVGLRDRDSARERDREALREREMEWVAVGAAVKEGVAERLVLRDGEAEMLRVWVDEGEGDGGEAERLKVWERVREREREGVPRALRDGDAVGDAVAHSVRDHEGLRECEGEAVRLWVGPCVALRVGERVREVDWERLRVNVGEEEVEAEAEAEPVWEALREAVEERLRLSEAV